MPTYYKATEAEVQAVIAYKKQNMQESYRRLTWRMVDEDIAYLYPSTVYRILFRAGLSSKWTSPPGEPRKRGFEQPTGIHEHWHIDIAYINFNGSFVYLISILDGYSRAIVSWSIQERMETFDVQMVLWRACEKWIYQTDYKPRVISDNGSQFVSREFKEALSDSGLTHARTSVNHPQSNGKLERFHGIAKTESLRNMPKLSLKQIRNEYGEWVDFYNQKRLHSAISYVTPYDVLYNRKEEIIQERKSKLDLGRKLRKKFFDQNNKQHNQGIVSLEKTPSP